MISDSIWYMYTELIRSHRILRTEFRSNGPEHHLERTEMPLCIATENQARIFVVLEDVTDS